MAQPIPTAVPTTYKHATELVRKKYAVHRPTINARDVASDILRRTPPAAMLHRVYISSASGDPEIALGHIQRLPRSMLMQVQAEISRELGPDWIVYESDGVLYATMTV